MDEKDKLFYTKLFEKCSPKPKDEFEDCCRDEANKTVSDRANIIMDKIMDKNLDKIEKLIDNDS